MAMPTHTTPADLLIPFGLWLGASALGVGVGLLTAFAGDTLFLIGLWPLAAALAGGFALVAASHLLRERRRAVHMVAAALFALCWLTADRAGDAWLFRLHQQQQVGQSGLLLADHAVLHDSDNPGELVDAALLAETGAAGAVGAARVQLRQGVPVLRVLRSTRVVRAPLWAHVLWLALRAAVVTLIVARALEQLRGEPVCARCGVWLRRSPRDPISDAEADILRRAWSAGERRTPADAPADPVGVVPHGITVLEDRCPRGHSVVPGYELRRPRGRRLSVRPPGPIARLPPLT